MKVKVKLTRVELRTLTNSLTMENTHVWTLRKVTLLSRRVAHPAKQPNIDLC